ncbi:MAG: (2Fe-2S)-binding protein [Spirochaetaceae bacterium]|nr:(2Fe-2S)-binding protein [Spirochaetaceae bacterium]
MEEQMASAVNRKICNCKNVSYNDVVKVLNDNSNFSQVEAAFQEVQNVTGCSTGCGGCHDEIMRTISEIMSL